MARIGNTNTFDGLFKIERGSAFYSALNAYTLKKENKPCWDFFNTRRYRISDKVISSRVMNHWQKEGLLPDGCQVEGQKWRNFTLIDLIWIAIVKNLRAFGISIALIQKVKKNFNTTYGECVFAELQFYSALAFFQKRPCEVLVFNHTEGEAGTVAEVATLYEIEETKRNQGGLPPHISITLNGLIQSIFPDKDLRPLYDNWVDLDEKEAEVLSKIKTGDYDEVAFSLENGKVVKLKGKSRRDKKNLHELQKEGGDQDLIVKMRNGKISHLEQTKIEKL